jgi:hypothetical protein
VGGTKAYSWKIIPVASQIGGWGDSRSILDMMVETEIQFEGGHFTAELISSIQLLSFNLHHFNTCFMHVNDLLGLVNVVKGHVFMQQ